MRTALILLALTISLASCSEYQRVLKNEEVKPKYELAQRLYEQEGSEWKVEGSNPEIFKYQFGEPDQFGITPLRMIFYGGAEILVAFQPADVEFPWQHKLDNKEPIDIKITFESTAED